MVELWRKSVEQKWRGYGCWSWTIQQNWGFPWDLIYPILALPISEPKGALQSDYSSRKSRHRKHTATTWGWLNVMSPYLYINGHYRLGSNNKVLTILQIDLLRCVWRSGLRALNKMRAINTGWMRMHLNKCQDRPNHVSKPQIENTATKAFGFSCWHMLFGREACKHILRPVASRLTYPTTPLPCRQPRPSPRRSWGSQDPGSAGGFRPGPSSALPPCPRSACPPPCPQCPSAARWRPPSPAGGWNRSPPEHTGRDATKDERKQVFKKCINTLQPTTSASLKIGKSKGDTCAVKLD